MWHRRDEAPPPIRLGRKALPIPVEWLLLKSQFLGPARQQQDTFLCTTGILKEEEDIDRRSGMELSDCLAAVLLPAAGGEPRRLPRWWIAIKAAEAEGRTEGLASHWEPRYTAEGHPPAH